MINLTKLQEEIYVWAKRNFAIEQAKDQFTGMVEELGELAHTILKQKQRIRKIDHDDEKDAIGDLFIFLCNYCSLRNIEIEKVIDETWKKVKKRDWIKYPFNGVDK